MWKKISSKRLFTHPRITLIADVVELPDGTKTQYLRFEKNGSAAGIICVRDDGKILLQKEYSYPSNQILFQFPGGLVSNEEEIKTGANRELMEESGLKANKLQLLGKYLTDNRRSSFMMYVYIGTELEEKSLVADKEEGIENIWVTEDEIDKLIKEEKIINCNVLASWSLYKASKL